MLDDGLGTLRFLHHGWRFCSTAPDECATPEDLQASGRTWINADVPCTVASALRAAGLWCIDGPERRFDADDWWFCLEFDAPADLGADASLDFDGLATLCEIWLNGTRLLSTTNMFLAQSVNAEGLRAGRNSLHMVFRSLDAALRQRRARPRWRVPMMEHQQLRWFRTTVLGRTPGWSLPAAPVGPWKPIRLASSHNRVEQFRLRSAVEAGTGLLHFSARTTLPQTATPPVLHLRLAGHTVSSASVTHTSDQLAASLRVDGIQSWWPHTHGRPTLYDAVLVLPDEGHGPSIELPLGRVGFRKVAGRASADGVFSLRVNGQEIFCRGACWTPLDPVSLGSDAEMLRQALEQAAAAGFNMLRISGTCVYEDEQFLSMCDELGIMIWQDFMFASMDYPADDEDFRTSVRQEAEQQLALWDRHTCVTVICGNSEVSQQSAMWGRPKEEWEPPLFSTTLRDLAQQRCPGACYWPSSTSGGDFPHQASAGTCSYYGVGAYQRELTDARQSGVAFATECLAFANIPEDETLAELPGGTSVRAHHSSWKRRSPRDQGAGWDFDDVRDHYLQSIFGVDPAMLRYADHGRYLVLGRQAVAEAMTAAFTEWRRPDSRCNGALVWFLRDMWPGAGWGIVDSRGRAKSPYFALRRNLQPLWIGMTDEGLNGIAIHVVNERPEPFSGHLDLTLYRDGQQVIGSGNERLQLPPRSGLTLNATSLLEGFQDLSYAYRFAPMSCDLIVAALRPANSGPQATAHFLPRRDLHAQPRPDCVLSGRAQRLPDSADYRLQVSSTCFARGVHVHAPGYAASDQYFDLAPGSHIELVLHLRDATSRPPAGFVTAINAAMPAAIQIIA